MNSWHEEDRGPHFFIGLDLGQAQDPTALAVIERRGDAKTGVCHVPQLKRYPIGTSYGAIVEEMAGKMRQAPEGTRLIVDATGVGRAVVMRARPPWPAVGRARP